MNKTRTNRKNNGALREQHIKEVALRKQYHQLKSKGLNAEIVNNTVVVKQGDLDPERSFKSKPLPDGMDDVSRGKFRTVNKHMWTMSLPLKFKKWVRCELRYHYHMSHTAKTCTTCSRPLVMESLIHGYAVITMKECIKCGLSDYSKRMLSKLRFNKNEHNALLEAAPFMSQVVCPSCNEFFNSNGRYRVGLRCPKCRIPTRD